MRMFKYERERCGLTQNALAEQLGVSQQTISKYENGSREPDLENLIRMAKIFHVTTDYLLGISEESSTYTLHEGEYGTLNSEITKRLEQLMSEKGVDIFMLSEVCNLTPEEMRSFVEYGYLPHVNVLLNLATYFEVSVDYLLCRSNSRQSPSTYEEDRLLNAFHQLSTDSRYILLGDALKELRLQQTKQQDLVSAEEK